jgi:hypothetical protein
MGWSQVSIDSGQQGSAERKPRLFPNADARCNDNRFTCTVAFAKEEAEALGVVSREIDGEMLL